MVRSTVCGRTGLLPRLPFRSSIRCVVVVWRSCSVIKHLILITPKEAYLRSYCGSLSLSLSLSIYIYIYVCVCVCVCPPASACETSLICRGFSWTLSKFVPVILCMLTVSSKLQPLIPLSETLYLVNVTGHNN